MAMAVDRGYFRYDQMIAGGIYYAILPEIYFFCVFICFATPSENLCDGFYHFYGT